MREGVYKFHTFLFSKETLLGLPTQGLEAAQANLFQLQDRRLCRGARTVRLRQQVLQDHPLLTNLLSLVRIFIRPLKASSLSAITPRRTCLAFAQS